MLEEVTNKKLKIKKLRRTRKKAHHIMNNSLLKKTLSGYKFSNLKENLGKLYENHKYDEFS